MKKQEDAVSRSLDTFQESPSQLPRAEQAEKMDEMLLSRSPGQSFSRWLRAAAIIAVISLLSLVLVPTLSAISFGLSLGGVFAALVSVVSLFVPALARSSLPFGVAQAVGVLLGLLLAAAGAGTFLGLRAYLRLAVRALRTAL